MVTRADDVKVIPEWKLDFYQPGAFVVYAGWIWQRTTHIPTEYVWPMSKPKETMPSVPFYGSFSWKPVAQVAHIEALERSSELIERLWKEVNWAKSFLSAKTIALLNETPLQIKACLANLDDTADKSID